MKFKELELIITLKDYPSVGIKKGTRGTIVVAFTEPNEAYDVEFVDNDGRTRAMLTLCPHEIEKYDSTKKIA